MLLARQLQFTRKTACRNRRFHPTSTRQPILWLEPHDLERRVPQHGLAVSLIRRDKFRRPMLEEAQQTWQTAAVERAGTGLLPPESFD
jgi:hypothetical protein